MMDWGARARWRLNGRKTDTANRDFLVSGKNITTGSKSLCQSSAVDTLLFSIFQISARCMICVRYTEIWFYDQVNSSFLSEMD